MQYKIVDGVLVLTAETPREGVTLGRLDRAAEGQGIAELSDEDPPSLSVPMRKREAAKPTSGKGRGTKTPDSADDSPAPSAPSTVNSEGVGEAS